MRGLGGGVKKRGVRELILNNKVDFIAIQETKLQVVNNRLCYSLWGNHDCDWDFVPSLSRSGGILSIWNASKFQKTSVVHRAGFLAVLGKWTQSLDVYCIVNVYSPCVLSLKLKLWEDLVKLKSDIGDAIWCVMGDFNDIRHSSERVGLSVDEGNRESVLFNSWIIDMEVVDLPLIGRSFTWYKASGSCMSRLDRILVSAHCPFKFNNFWVKRKDFKEFVSNSWNNMVVQGWSAFVVKEKLRNLKTELKLWSREVFGSLDQKLSVISKEVLRIDLEGGI
ncbi:PREDICTED: uncharacterized protein LOC109352963 [Lupinus angustifolius]|uniref:uncharacterized protein LOC109352963 n=1 Tax=Lupinus angustifolius TaxID=3871 RepID=UPI00092F4D1C|nr:PREDICTED: uncharacterized protein LOC109352963 [Lupinus angustifolius]